MNGKKPLVDFRSAPKLQTSLMLSGALIGFFGAQGGSKVLTVLGIVLILASGAVWSLYYRCPHCMHAAAGFCCRSYARSASFLSLNFLPQMIPAYASAAKMMAFTVYPIRLVAIAAIITSSLCSEKLFQFIFVSYHRNL